MILQFNFSIYYSRTEKEDEIEDYYRRKYAENSTTDRRYNDGDVELSDEITQQTLLPGVK